MVVLFQAAVSAGLFVTAVALGLHATAAVYHMKLLYVLHRSVKLLMIAALAELPDSTMCRYTLHACPVQSRNIWWVLNATGKTAFFLDHDLKHHPG